MQNVTADIHNEVSGRYKHTVPLIGHTSMHGPWAGGTGLPCESLIDWDKGLLMRQIAHQAGMTCF